MMFYRLVGGQTGKKLWPLGFELRALILAIKEWNPFLLKKSLFYFINVNNHLFKKV